MALVRSARTAPTNGANSSPAILPSSSLLALRQKGSFRSLKIRVEDVPFAPEVDVSDLGLRLEHRTRIRFGKALSSFDDLLELIQHEHGPAPALVREILLQLQQPLDRLVDVAGALAP